MPFIFDWKNKLHRANEQNFLKIDKGRRRPTISVGDHNLNPGCVVRREDGSTLPFTACLALDLAYVLCCPVSPLVLTACSKVLG
jgi:hypothetical protein